MSNWRDEEAASYCRTYATHGEDLALRVYTTRLLGRDHTLVLHGGGNTSVKTVQKDELGRAVEVICVKGSGWDMGDIEPEGMPAVCLEPVREFRQLNAMSDKAMVNGVRRHLLDAGAPTPSVETLLHAFLPHKFIDHTHADAILALVDQAGAEELCRNIFGDSMGIVPYIMPGFKLSKKAAEVYESNPEVEGLILINHGIFSFGATARQAYERMMRAVGLARDYLQDRKRETVFLEDATPLAGDEYPLHLAVLRGILSRREEGIGSVILHRRYNTQIEAFLSRPDWVDLASRGPATPDHVIRTKQKPLLIENPDWRDPAVFGQQVEQALDAYIRAYREYFATQTRDKREEKTPLHPMPHVILIPGMGLITAAKTIKEARIAADIYEHTVDIILKAELVDRYQPLPDDHLFDMEYWSLEQAKLGKKQFRAMDGKVTLVTGALGGIGGAIARVFARAGSHLVLTDIAEKGLAEFAGELAQAHKIEVVTRLADLGREEDANQLVDWACNRLGGLDVVVSNAGRAFHGPMAETTTQLKQSLDINLLAHQYLAAAAARAMTVQGLGGCLLFNASKSAFNPGSGFGAYSVPKAALIALMKQYALELAPQGIRCLAVNADRVRTPLFDRELLAARARARGLDPEAYFKANLLQREVTADDVAQAFFHLYLSEKTTGAVLAVDGGNIAASPR